MTTTQTKRACNRPKGVIRLMDAEKADIAYAKALARGKDLDAEETWERNFAKYGGLNPAFVKRVHAKRRLMTGKRPKVYGGFEPRSLTLAERRKMIYEAPMPPESLPGHLITQWVCDHWGVRIEALKAGAREHIVILCRWHASHIAFQRHAHWSQEKMGQMLSIDRSSFYNTREKLYGSGTGHPDALAHMVQADREGTQPAEGPGGPLIRRPGEPAERGGDYARVA